MMTALLCFFFFTLAINAKLAPLLNDNSEDVIPDQYIVVYKENTPVNVFKKQIDNLKTSASGNNIGFIYENAIKGFSAKLFRNQLLQLRQDPNVDFIEVDKRVRTAQSSCTEEPSGSWGQTRVAQHDILLNGRYQATSTGGAGVTAYIVDTGIYVEHDDFHGRASFGFKADETWPDTDVHGHGTHVASTVGGRLYGIAKQVDLVSVIVLGPDGSGSNAGVIAGVDYVVSQHVKKGKPSTANLSLGGGRSSALNNAVNFAVGKGIVFVVAAGNEDDDACYYSPASATEAISVGATGIDTNDNGDEADVRSPFSNYGTCVSIFAPGSLIKAAWIGSKTATNTISGTSMASPHVCGITALLLGDSPNSTPTQIKNSLIGNSNKNMIDMFCVNSDCEKSPNALVYNGC